MPDADVVLKVSNLTYRYGDLVAVKSLDLAINRGEIFGFLGPNGAGKTTTIRAILDFLRPGEGQVSIFGIDTRQGGIDQVKHRLGYLPSEFDLWKNWRGVDYIRWLESIHKKPLLAEARQLAERLQFDLDRSLQGLSTGMKRKMGLIATLAPQPELLIMDEPTAGLDPLMQHEFNDLMREVRDAGRTVFMSSHILPEVETICDRVAIIRQGELQAVESVEDMTQLAFRNFVLDVGSQDIDIPALASINGVLEATRNGSTLHLRVGGQADLTGLLRAVAQYQIYDLTVRRPSLEEIFLAYYGEEA